MASQDIALEWKEYREATNLDKFRYNSEQPFLKYDNYHNIKKMQSIFEVLVPDFKKIFERMDAAEKEITLLKTEVSSLKEQKFDLQNKLDVALIAVENHGIKISSCQTTNSK